ncbi:MAG: protein kinase family protein [Lachnospiraceae bacterium]|nr:protein kinase family protein [Lachnospiraceae bacterium]
MNGDMITFLKKKDYIMVNDDLGGGSFGKAVLLQDPFINELFVAKMYKPMYEEIKEKFYTNFLDEIKILHKLNHPNIVRIYNYYAYEEYSTGYIIMEYVEGKNIDKFFEEYTGIWDEVSLDDIFLQLIEAFVCIEEKKIIHRDIREGNILIDKDGVVKIIDFGIGKIFAEEKEIYDSLVVDINRANSDTLPKEYYDGVYTSKTDMFYLAELFSRLLQLYLRDDYLDFSYHNILSKMMMKKPEDRYNSFSEVKETINKHDFINLPISDEDKRTYQSFVNIIFYSLSSFVNEQKFNYDTNSFVLKLENTLRNNLFEDVIQKNADVIGSIVICGFKYSNEVEISCDAVKRFLNWYKKSTEESKKLILSNIISKLSTINIINEYEELPFN